MALIWIDTETTGLDARKHRLLEVAAIATDDQLQEIARFERVIRWEPAAAIAAGRPEVIEAHEVVPVVLEMHAANGLWGEVAASTTEMHEVDEQLAAFISQHAPKSVLAGSTVSFDRGFLEVNLPRSAAALHYRHLDVTSVNELARRFWPAVEDARPRASGGHRAMADIADSLAVARYYATALAPAFQRTYTPDMALTGTTINPGQTYVIPTEVPVTAPINPSVVVTLPKPKKSK